MIDRRLEEKKLLQYLNSNKIEIHVRSIFLQGLLTHHFQNFQKIFEMEKIFKKLMIKYNIIKYQISAGV